MRRSTTWAALATLCALAACVKPSKVVGVSCEADGDCAAGGTLGTCQSTGFCSYPDASCTGGQRYTPGAGDGLGNSCIGGDVACGAVGQACCGGAVCGADLECTDNTCQCGGDSQVCCGGSTCSANLACGEDARCACGAIGEPCCGGATCDTGVTCEAGTCTAGVQEVALGSGHACVVRTDHSVWCWGADFKAYPNETNPNLNVIYIGSSTPRRVPVLTDVASLGSSEYSICARKTDGTVWCWGHNESGQLGDGTFVGRRTPAQIQGLTNVTMLEGGRYHMCAVGSYNGTAGAWCWGRGGRYGRPDPTTNVPDPAMGRLGNNDVVDKNTPVAVDLSAAASAGQTVRSLSTGSYHSCVVMSDDTVWCWGRGSSGQLGNGANTTTKVPVQVTFAGITIPNGVTVEQVSCSDGGSFYGFSTCMRLSDGTVYCWGYGSFGDMGDGTTTGRNAPGAPVDITALAGDKIVDIASGHNHHCALTQGGDVWCWGYNKRGAVGNGNTTDENITTPSKVLNVANVTQLEVSHRATCVVTDQHKLFCWGSNIKNKMLTQDASVATPVEVVP